jgi:alkylated DNA repair protein alkB family protein 8
MNFVFFIFVIMSATLLERQFVQATYNSISRQFDGTRFCMWPEVVRFLDSLPSGSLIADIGCGNGKYLNYRARDCAVVACDTSAELLKIARERRAGCLSFSLGNMLALPYRTGLFDAVINVAVLHHISTRERRVAAVKELIRIVRTGGKICISAWADEQVKKTKWQLCNTNNSNTDYMIPFDKRNGEVIMRYYHLFTEDDFKDVLNKCSLEAKVESFVFDKDNWIAILRKI